jgi:hypothetical protein
LRSSERFVEITALSLHGFVLRSAGSAGSADRRRCAATAAATGVAPAFIEIIRISSHGFVLQ